MLHTKSQQLYCTKVVSMLTGLKVSSLECKCVVKEVPIPMELNFEGLEMQKMKYTKIEFKG